MKTLIISIASLAVLASCSYPMGLVGIGSEVMGDNDSASLMNPSLEPQAMAIIEQNCTGCHTQTGGPANVYNLTDTNHLLTTGMLVPGDADASFLYTITQSDQMPPGGGVSQSDKDILRRWIAGDSGGSTPTPTPTPSPSPTPIPTPTPSPTPSPTPTPTPTPTPVPTVTYASLRASIFQPKCLACHTGSSAKAGVALDTYAGATKTNSINKTTPTSSRIYVTTKNGSMPTSGAKLTADQYNSLLIWVQNGAPEK